MYGWRGRIGLLVPSTNFVAEVEFGKAVPDGVTVHTARCMLKDITDWQNEKDKADSLIQMGKEVVKASREVACIKPKVLAWTCTSGSFVGGVGYDQELIRKMEAETSIPAITTSTSVVKAFKAMKIKKVAFATPYIKELDDKAKAFFEGSVPGLKIITLQSLRMISSYEKSVLEPKSAYIAGREVDSSEADAVFIDGTAWRSFEIIETLEKDIKKPVISSNSATLWAALKVIGVSGISGYGQLLEKY